MKVIDAIRVANEVLDTVGLSQALDALRRLGLVEGGRGKFRGTPALASLTPAGLHLRLAVLRCKASA